MAPCYLVPLLQIYAFCLAKDLAHIRQPTIDYLRRMELIEYSKYESPGDTEDYYAYDTTDKGNVFIEGVMAVRLPIKKWSIPNYEN